MKQQPMARKLLALCLSLLLVLALSPTAWAEGEKAQVGEKKYATVQDAINAIQSGSETGTTIQLIANSTTAVTIDAGVSVTIDLAGFSMTAEEDVISNRGTLVINDSKGTGSVTTNAAGKGALVNYPGATATISGGTFTATGWYTLKNLGTMTINSGATITTPTGGASLIDNGWYGNAGNDRNETYGSSSPVLTINGGNFSGGMNTVKNDDYATVNILGGTFHNTTGPTVLNWHIANISGGDFSVPNGAVIANGYLSDTADKGELNISGGTFTAGNGGTDTLLAYGVGGRDGGKLSITGGEFNGQMIDDNNSDLPYNVVVEGGAFSQPMPETTLAEDTLAVKSGEKYYVGDAAQDAVEAAQAGDTIEVVNGKKVTDVPAGVTVTNGTNDPITVNDKTVPKDGNTTIPEPEQPSKPSTPSFTEPEYYPDYDEDVEYLPPIEDEEEEEKAPLYMVTCRTLNVRMGPGTSYAKLGTLSRGTLISGEYENGWVKFTYNGQTAYSSADYLMQVDSDLSGLHVTCRTLNVRAGAGTNFDILGTLSRGTEISMRDVLPGWYEIDFLGGIGYVSSAYIG